jgi:hypothetical protein
MASGEDAAGVDFNRSWAILTDVGTRVNLIDPDADETLESIELVIPVVLGLVLNSGPGEAAQGEGSGFKGEMVETASETLAGIAKGEERPVREMDIRR